MVCANSLALNLIILWHQILIVLWHICWAWWADLPSVIMKCCVIHFPSTNVDVSLEFFSSSVFGDPLVFSNKKFFFSNTNKLCDPLVLLISRSVVIQIRLGGHVGSDRMVVGFTKYYLRNQCLSLLQLWVRIPFMARFTYTTLWLATGQWFSPGTPISSTNDHHNITEILLKVALNTITLTSPQYNWNIVESGVKHHKPSSTPPDLIDW